jgi:hypothetical protein
MCAASTKCVCRLLSYPTSTAVPQREKHISAAGVAAVYFSP